eukprot:CAMPEP_0113422776 /NCGR_PEP_ID=MMETSP0013_2-20120614/28644_1 /TAXON_ID=2843 ORGANISM="Skeletonema costatum, Strain 1716" /NCGR_SAMPLE_ID=MMETSP0013_2 /ASSEMBLY_ACC=CAM_ASM_000158 /LENGTH=137 /DNA_ID=CAMNT_0000310549 /DNA_START=21 /DNA_END=434 /DNA_ORIENTATION=- /assembly_acc=CAM_ASM_000158
MAFVWDPYKTTLLIKAVLMFGHDWIRIAKIVKCNNVQAQTKWQALMKRQDFNDNYSSTEKRLRVIMKKLLPKINSPHIAITPTHIPCVSPAPEPTPLAENPMSMNGEDDADFNAWFSSQFGEDNAELDACFSSYLLE